MTKENPTLKYLFTATYLDGTVYQQNAEDRSVKEPDKRSCFFDLDQERLACFVLKGDGHEFGVDLRDGHFEIDGVPFKMHEDVVKTVRDGHTGMMALRDFKLIFYRNHTHSFIVNQQTEKEVSHDIVYRMGWQCTVDGKNYQQVMQFE